MLPLAVGDGVEGLESEAPADKHTRVRGIVAVGRIAVVELEEKEQAPDVGWWVPTSSP